MSACHGHGTKTVVEGPGDTLASPGIPGVDGLARAPLLDLLFPMTLSPLCEYCPTRVTFRVCGEICRFCICRGFAWFLTLC